MKLPVQPLQFEKQLNSTLKSFQHNFQILENKSELRIENFAPIYFAHYIQGRVAGGSTNWVQRKHKNNEVHEPAMIAALLVLQKYLPAPVFLDIGALYGYFSLMVHSLFTDAQICAFEMNPESFASLEKNFLENQKNGENRLRCVNIGLSDRTVSQHKSKIENFRLCEETDSTEGVSLDLMTLDDFCLQQNLQPTLMKIDVEGYQAKIIPGAMRTISQYKPTILLEFDHTNLLQNFGKTNKEIVRPLFDLGYSLFWCNEQRRNDSYFQYLSYDDLSSKHEKNSLALFVQI